MNTIESTEIEKLPVRSENIIEMPLGLLGFEQIKKFVLLANPEEEPFYWLQVLEDPGLAFLVLSPFQVLPDYQPDIPAEDTEYLGIRSADDVLVLNIVTRHGDGRITVNLKGPVVINRFSLKAKQVVINNAGAYSCQHPLPVTH